MNYGDRGLMMGRWGGFIMAVGHTGARALVPTLQTCPVY